MTRACLGRPVLCSMWLSLAALLAATPAGVWAVTPPANEPAGAASDECRGDAAANGACTVEDDSSGLLQFKVKQNSSMDVDQVPRNETSDCVGANADPDALERPCCAHLTKCYGDWFATGTYSHLCLAECPTRGKNEALAAPTSTGLNICASTTKFDTTSLWRIGDYKNQQSCNDTSKIIRGDNGFACQDASGAKDPTSLYVDMSILPNKQGCFQWTMEGTCKWNMRRVMFIEFDLEWSQCADLWFAPLWMFAKPWVGPQGTSGEIDLVESCPVPHVTTNLGCKWGAPASADCYDGSRGEAPWGEGAGSKEPKHIVLKIDFQGNLFVEVCDLGGKNCKDKASYMKFLDTVTPTKNKDDPSLYHLTSDVWNSAPGDGGWYGCNAKKNLQTNCKFAVTNLMFTSNDGKPIFEDEHCYVLNQGVRGETTEIDGQDQGHAGEASSVAPADDQEQPEEKPSAPAGGTSESKAADTVQNAEVDQVQTE